VLSSEGKARRVGIVGLGAGTLATNGREGDSFRFYEINPAVIQIASRYYHFLDTSPARTDVLMGDGRLALEKLAPDSFDAIVPDAFPDDSIPVHLPTKPIGQLCQEPQANPTGPPLACGPTTTATSSKS
jgi:spermidine synthase